MSIARPLIASLLLLASPALAGDPDVPLPETAKVVAVYDGDTLTLSTGQKVRLRGVNTPELKPPEAYGLEARDLATALTLNHDVKLSYGPTAMDGYGRLLASVEVDGQDLAAALAEQGFGHVFSIPPDSLDLAPLFAAQELARAANRGIWSTDRYSGDLHITSFHANADGDDRQNVNGEYLRVCNVSPNPIDLKGYRISDITGTSWELPALIIPPGNTVKLMSGVGANQADPTQQLEVHLQSTSPIWNNKRDRATLYDRFGRVIDSRLHEVERETP